MAKWNEYSLKSGTSAEDEVLILDSDTNTNKRTTVGDIQEFANGKVLEKENYTLNTEAKDLIGAINEVDAKNDAQDTKIEKVENKFSDYLKKTDVDRTLSVPGSPADAKVVGDALGKSKKAIEELSDKKITKFYASNQGNTHLPDSDKGKIQDMFLYGKSEQVQYKGKNLFNKDNYRSNTYIANTEGKLADSNSMYTTNDIYVKKGVTVSISSTGTKRRGYYNKDKTKFTYLDSSDSTFTAPEDCVLIISCNYETTAVDKFQVEIGETATSYEPYTGGIPSPNPDYPQEIKAVVNPKVVVRGKNLFDFVQFKGTDVVRGSAVYDENGVTITSTGTDCFTLYSYTDKVLKIPVKSRKKYTLSWKASDDISGSVVVFYDGSSSSYNVVNNANTKKNVFTVPANRTFVTIRLGVAQSGKTIRYYDIQLEENDDSTTYQPYTEQSTTLPYTLYAIPVSSGGNITIGGKQYVADYVDVERGKLVRMCKEIDLGALGFVKDEEAQFYRAKKINNMVKPLNNISKAYVIAKEYTVFSWQSISNKDTGIAFDSVSGHIIVSNGLSGVPKGKMIYLLVTPEEIDLTPDQIQTFKSLSTNYPVTNIEVSSDQLDGYTVFNYPISMADGWNYIKQQIGDTRDYIYDMDLQSAEAYVNSEYAVALTELEVM